MFSSLPKTAFASRFRFSSTARSLVAVGALVFVVLTGVSRAELTPDSPDPAFVPQFPDRFARAIVKTLPDGKLLVSQNRVELRRLLPNGQVDSSFATAFAEETTPLMAELAPDGRVLLAAYFFPNPNTVVTRLVRLVPNGERDSSFAGGDGVLVEAGVGEGNPVISGLHSLPSGKVMVSGRFARVAGRPARDIVRLHTDGTVDETFQVGLPASHGILSSGVQSDGKTILGATYSRPGLTSWRMIRLNVDGSLDLTFNLGAGPDSEPYGILVQPDDRIVIGGAFKYVAGWLRPGIARLLPDGSVDQSFNPGDGGTNGYLSLPFTKPAHLLRNGKLLLIGSFQNYDSFSRRFFVRINADGSLDESFGPGFAGDREVNALDVFADGRIALAGDFTHRRHHLSWRGGAARRRISRSGSHCFARGDRDGDRRPRRDLERARFRFAAASAAMA